MKSTSPASLGFLRVAAAAPKLRVANPRYNTDEILALAKDAAAKGASAVVFPELSITGYTAADLFSQRLLLKKAEQELIRLARATKNLNTAIIVGFPLQRKGALWNAAAVIAKGKILGFTLKTYIPNYKEFYEKRWFASGKKFKATSIKFDGRDIPAGTNLLFHITDGSQALFGVEICEDLWTPIPPSSLQALGGANLVFNLSASNETVGKADYRRQLVLQQSARSICGYIYASSGVHESSTDLVFSGHSLIAENGVLLAESQRFVQNGEMIIADIDIEHLFHDRAKLNSFKDSSDLADGKKFTIIDVPLSSSKKTDLMRAVDMRPFVPSYERDLHARTEEIFAMQSTALAKRLSQAGIKKMIIGLSGGLDSTLALLVAHRAAKLLNIPPKNIIAVTMPGFATSKRTKSNAHELAKSLGVTFRDIDITKGATQGLRDIGHSTKKQDVVFENVQARYRTMILMDLANSEHGIVVGTGDLSEIALGWNTFTGDQISHYHVNAGVPKTLVRHLVAWVAEQKDFAHAKKVLNDIIATPISPELVRGKKGMQETETIIGPYDLHDFFLYHFIRWGSSPKKISLLAKHAFKKSYTEAEIKKWLSVFIKRFFGNQWKRSVMPDGPKIGSISLSPRGDWRMPSDADLEAWMKEL